MTTTVKPYRLEVEDGLVGLPAAVSVAVAILKKTKCRSWQELESAVSNADPHVCRILAAGKFRRSLVELLTKHSNALLYLRTDAPAVSLLVCDVCEEWITTTRAAKPKCTVTLNCPGTMVKPKIARSFVES